MKALLIYSTLLACLIGLSAAASNKEPCKTDADCDQRKFLKCTKVPFDTRNSQHCGCPTGTVWQGAAKEPECRVRDGGTCEVDAQWTSDKLMCMDGFDCGGRNNDKDDTTEETSHLCMKNPLGVLHVRKPNGKPTTPATPSEVSETSDPDAAQASKWKEEHPESVSEVNEEKPSELDPEASKPMGRSMMRAGGMQGTGMQGSDMQESSIPQGRSFSRGQPENRQAPADGSSSTSGDTKTPGNVPPVAPAAPVNTGTAAETDKNKTPATQPSDKKGETLAEGKGEEPDPLPIEHGSDDTNTPEPEAPGGNNTTPAGPHRGHSDINDDDDPLYGDTYSGSPSKDELKALYEEFYGSFAVTSKTLSSAVAILTLMAGTLIL